MLARSILITGCSRGLGLELTKQLVPHAEVLIATCRDPVNATELRLLAEQHTNVKIFGLNVLEEGTFPELVKNVSAVVGKRGLNVLINNVGILSMASKTEPFYTGEMAEVYATNVIAPAKLTKALLPLLKAAGASESVDDFLIQHALVINFSSVYGCISQASTGLYLPYRCSKAALNMLTKCLSSELKPFNISVISVHPGSVQTDMGGPNAPLTKAESVSSILKVLFKITPENSGQFFNWKGDNLPW